MAIKFDLRRCLKLIDSGLSANDIARHHHIGKASTSKTKKRKEELQFDMSTLDQYSDIELGKLFFPESFESEEIYAPVDYDYVHRELARNGVTLKLLWKEYKIGITDDKLPVSYSTYCRGYEGYVSETQFTSRIEHKPGVRVEVDYAGSTMSYTVPATGEVVTVYLFVATLPFSQYTYVEPILDMKMDTWIRCNIHMFEFFGGSTTRVVCDNLKTGVVSHPKEGDIILTETYKDFGDHYMTAIMPAQVRKPKQIMRSL